MAAVGLLLGAIAFAYIGKLGFVSSACLALVFAIGFGGWGARMQLERARRIHPGEAVDGVAAVLRILIVFALVTPFWSLFDQKASPWILQANHMARPEWFHPAQMQALNPILVLLLIPVSKCCLMRCSRSAKCSCPQPVSSLPTARRPPP